ncbi:hypothetical protein FTUN_5668 [Frigoriglobus tundricola]|uniref:Uncharacterized protein n=1 Tax=Frigoriglobus tundricola TaxID=2774151 RepID=A0A6M5YVZ0_9BACT|nr:hypothetical protein FTUN_5668 [Frigoriglobus tundricola]
MAVRLTIVCFEISYLRRFGIPRSSCRIRSWRERGDRYFDFSRPEIENVRSGVVGRSGVGSPEAV